MANRVAFITGGGKYILTLRVQTTSFNEMLASGIGLATARLLRASGWAICISDMNDKDGKKAASELEGKFYKSDVSDYNSLSGAFHSAFQDHKRLDFVFANAGTVEKENFYRVQKTTPPPPLDQSVMGVNIIGVQSTVYLAQHYFRLSKESGASDPAIVITSSAAGLYSSSLLPMYTSSKFGVVGLVHAIAPILLYRDNIRISAICPGSIRTNLIPQERWDVMTQEAFTKVDFVASTVKGLVDSAESSGKIVELVAGETFERKRHEYSNPVAEAMMERGVAVAKKME